ncbi:aminopeptidase P family protein [Aerococcaceae bacterium DSM 111176]|nr:aminopeptidase P family protein [Aerococcaceae bacterium DSM 111176]
MHQARIQKLTETFNTQGIDAMLITEPKNIRYLSSFTGSTATLFITSETAYFITDFRYDQQAHEQATGYEVVIHSSSMFKEIAHIIAEDNIQRVGFEADNVTVSLFNQLNDLFEAEMVPTSAVIETLREIKDGAEIKVIEESAKIMDEAYAHILEFIEIGMTELEVANELERFCKEKGASSMSFDTIVASGPRSAMPHGVASDKKIEKDEMVTIDFGCYYKGYTADMTRTFATGEVDDKLKEIYQIVFEAQRLVNEQAKAGMTGAEIDAIARDYITEHGYGEYFGHSTGHGIGLDIHENPRVASSGDKKIVAGNVITNEPGIYLEGLGGVRIEDDIVIYEGATKIINSSPKELIII